MNPRFPPPADAERPRAVADCNAVGDDASRPRSSVARRLARVAVAQARLPTRWGPLTAVATPNGLAGLWFDGQRHHPGPLDAASDPTHPWLVATARALAAYECDAHDVVLPPLDPQGTAFQLRVWAALRALCAGRTTTYAALAAAVGTPRASRAVGAAVGRNPVSILVPCHRVVGADGTLTGYAGGLDRKAALLAHEGASPRTPRPP